MVVWINALIFIFGTIVGSFLNVVIYRYGTGRSVISGRSQCLACARTLRWYELVPVLSFLLQSGRCRLCNSKLAWQYPLVEILTGLLFVLVWQLALPLFLLPIYLTIVSLLVVITVYDLRHKIIPDGLVFTFDLLALAPVFYPKFDPTAAIAGPLLFLFFAALWYFSGGRWMGFGDAKLALGVGWLLGLRGGISAIILAFWIGAAVGLALIALTRLRPRAKLVTIKSELPFAPFIILGLALNLFFHLNLWLWIT